MLGRVMGKVHRSKLREAEKHILEGIEILDRLKEKPFYSVGHLYLGELYSDAGQKEKALENINKAESMFQEMGMDYWLGKTQEVLARL